MVIYDMPGPTDGRLDLSVVEPLRPIVLGKDSTTLFVDQTGSIDLFANDTYGSPLVSTYILGS